MHKLKKPTPVFEYALNWPYILSIFVHLSQHSKFTLNKCVQSSFWLAIAT